MNTELFLFFRKITSFIVLLSIITVTTFLCINLRIREIASFKISPNIKYISLGHSHTQHAFNDSLISDFKNLGFAAESYFYTLIKTKMVLEQNRNIELVFIEFSNNQIIGEMDTWIWGERVSSRYSTLTPFMSLEDHALIFNNNCSLFFENLSISTKIGLENLITENLDYSRKIGWYSSLRQNKVDSILGQHPTENKKLSISTGFSFENIKNLKLLINYCQDKGKRVFLIRSPLHKKYPLLSNELIYKSVLNSELNNLDYLDFSKYPLSDSEFGDLQHVNYRGSAKFSRWFDQLLKDGLIYKKDKQKFINEQINIID